MVRKEVHDYCERLGIEFNENIIPFYLSGKKMLEKESNAIVNIQRLTLLNKKYNIFRKWFDDVTCAAEKIEHNPDMLLFTYILFCIIKDDAPLSIINMPNFECIETDFLPLYSLLFFLEDIIAALEKRGLPFEVISDTLQGFEAETDHYFALYGRSGMRTYVSWFLLYVQGKIIRVGRLNFEMDTFNQKVRAYVKGNDVKILIDGEYLHKKGMVFGSANQTEPDQKYFAQIEENEDSVTGYAANQYGEAEPKKITLHGYREFLRYGDNVLSVHIPDGGPLTPQLCEESFQNAKIIFEKYYPEYNYKAFSCISWLLEKRLHEILGKTTNITQFADRFAAFPIFSKGTMVYSYVYHFCKPIPPTELPENNSMQKSIKRYLRSGNSYYEKGGVIPNLDSME